MLFMNHLVFLDAQAGELEKISSGLKTMLIKEFDPALTPAHPVNPGDSLYFPRNSDECTLCVKATVVRVLPIINDLDKSLLEILKEMQPKLQFTEDQFHHWSAKKQVLLVEFESARKIEAIQITLDKDTDEFNWIAFRSFSLDTEFGCTT
jgi:hypothetical protein